MAFYKLIREGIKGGDGLVGVIKEFLNPLKITAGLFVKINGINFASRMGGNIFFKAKHASDSLQVFPDGLTSAMFILIKTTFEDIDFACNSLTAV